MFCINTPPWPMLPWLRCRMKNGARRLAPLSKSLMAKTPAKTSCVIGAARILPALKCQVNFGLNQFPKHRLERFKNMRFANALLLVATPIKIRSRLQL